MPRKEKAHSPNIKEHFVRRICKWCFCATIIYLSAWLFLSDAAFAWTQGGSDHPICGNCSVSHMTGICFVKSNEFCSVYHMVSWLRSCLFINIYAYWTFGSTHKYYMVNTNTVFKSAGLNAFVMNLSYIGCCWFAIPC